MSENVTLEDVWKLIHATSLQIKETDLQVKETSITLQNLALNVGRISNQWGEFVEGLVAPACSTMFAERGIPVHSVSHWVTATLPPNRQLEIDLLVLNTDCAILVEAKSRLKTVDIQNHLTRLSRFKEFFPIYADYRVMGAVAGIAIDAGVKQFAMRRGLFVIVGTGNNVKLANLEEFTPRVW